MRLNAVETGREGPRKEYFHILRHDRVCLHTSLPVFLCRLDEQSYGDDSQSHEHDKRDPTATRRPERGASSVGTQDSDALEKRYDNTVLGR